MNCVGALPAVRLFRRLVEDRGPAAPFRERLLRPRRALDLG